MPRSRFKLAVPFVGKDVPAQASEFAHPDVILGLSVLAYRYEGLREAEFREDVIALLRNDFEREVGPYAQVRHAIPRLLPSYCSPPARALRAASMLPALSSPSLHDSSAVRAAQVRKAVRGMGEAGRWYH